MQHSKIVGGSTAKRVIGCPASVKLVQKMPPQAENQYMSRGTLCHNALDVILSKDVPLRSVIGMTYADQTLDEELFDSKIKPALLLLEEVDPDQKMEYITEVEVSLDHLIPGVFGNADLIGRIGRRAVVLDWKMGDGVPVDAEENMQGMFYALAAMHTPATRWAFDGAGEVEIIIIQPPHIRRWVTTPARIVTFGNELVEAVKMSERDNAPFNAGEWCRFCTAKPVCPKMTGAVDRALKTSLDALPVEHINNYLKNADLLEQWITDIRALAYRMMDEGDISLPDWKLVAKRATRKWRDAPRAEAELKALGINPYAPQEVLSPAQAEKALKKVKKELPDELVVSVSSGSTMAPKDDPRPAVLNIGKQLNAALAKLQ
jgi:hypothetical protein